ncbi:MAG: type II toxin-antitoxin system VapC family toxin [Desulfobulbaceae bacterium]|nr:type II toxin-antitoxin system VapC family toxin [Desulfobulbaceae bacterium]
MQYVLDTNICIAIIRKKSPLATQRLTQQPVTSVALSTVTIAELQFGVHKSSDPAKNQQALEQFLVPFVFLDFDYDATQTYGVIRAYLEAQGTPIGALDTLIAAQALAHQLIMVTNNVREFARVPNLRVEDWTKP